jgi:hypothetical protein
MLWFHGREYNVSGQLLINGILGMWPKLARDRKKPRPLNKCSQCVVGRGAEDLRASYPTIQVVNNENQQYESEGNAHYGVNPVQKRMVFTLNVSAAPSLNFPGRGIVYNNPDYQKCDKLLHRAAIVLP